MSENNREEEGVFKSHASRVWWRIGLIFIQVILTVFIAGIYSERQQSHDALIRLSTQMESVEKVASKISSLQTQISELQQVQIEERAYRKQNSERIDRLEDEVRKRRIKGN